MNSNLDAPYADNAPKHRNIFAVLFIWYYISGMEYGLIFSSINSYLQQLAAASFYLGLALAAFPAAGLIFGAIFGRLTDKRHRIRRTLLIGIAFSVLGNALYFAVPNRNVVVFGRFLGGIGNAIDGAIMGHAALLKGPRNRQSTFALLLVTKQAGTITVPLWQRLIRLLQSYFLQGYSIESTYGLGLVILWSTNLILAYFLLRDEEALTSHETKETVTDNQQQLLPKKDIIAAQWVPAFVNEPFVVAIISSFSIIFLQASMETMVTPFNRSYFGWSTVQNGLEFMMIGICALIGYSMMKFMSLEVECDGVMRKRVETKYTFIGGVSGCWFVSVATACVISLASFQETWLYCSIFASIIIFCICLPFGVVSSATVIAKFTPDNRQSLTQSLRFVCERVAQILAPIWVSSLGPAETQGYTGFLIMFPSIIFLAFATISLASCWRFL